MKRGVCGAGVICQTRGVVVVVPLLTPSPCLRLPAVFALWPDGAMASPHPNSPLDYPPKRQRVVKSEEAAPDKSPEMQHRDSADSVITPYLASDEPASVASDLSTASNLSTSPRLSNTATTAVDGGLVPVGDRCLMDTNAIARVLGLNTPPQWVTTVKMQLVQAYTQLQLAYQQQLQMKPQHELHVFKQKQVQQSQHAFGQKYVQIATKMHALQQKHPKAWQQLLAQHQQGQPNPQLQQALLAGYKHASQQAGAQQVQVQMPLPLQMQMQMQLPQGASSSLKTPLGGPVFRRGRAHAGGVHMTMQQKESTLPVQALVHAFHCADPACQQKTCADTKLVLKRMEAHVQQCPARRAQQSAQQGGPSPQQAECKVCKLSEALHRTRSSSGEQQSMLQQQGGMQSSAAGRGQPNQRELRQMMQDDPAQLKQILLSHVRACKDGQCKTCHKLRERIKSRAASSSHRARGQHQMTLPKGWEVCIARSSGDLYYYQPKTNKSQWDYPKPDGLASNEASSSHRAQGQHQQQPPSTGQPHGTGGDVAPMISLSVPVLLTTVKTLVPPETHEQLDQMLQRYMQKEIGKQQVCSSSSPISTPPYLTLAACRSPHPLPPPSLTASPPLPP